MYTQAGFEVFVQNKSDTWCYIRGKEICIRILMNQAESVCVFMCAWVRGLKRHNNASSVSCIQKVPTSDSLYNPG